MTRSPRDPLWLAIDAAEWHMLSEALDYEARTRFGLSTLDTLLPRRSGR